MKKRALISVFDKRGILEFAKFLYGKDVEIISTGGTYKYLKENGLEVTEISEVTNFKEMLDGRVKTLHPNIHGGILAVRNNKEHMETIEKEGIQTIDFVIVNLYPFFKEVQTDKSFDEKIEFIDIGGLTMLRSAAKSFANVTVICDAEDYTKVREEIESKGETSFETRKRLAGKVFNLTSAYDAAISNFLLNEEYPKYLSLSYEKKFDLRYGENPHQTSAYYVSTTENGSMKNFVQLNGKELSFNNIRDMDIAWKVVGEFDEIACCAVKHSTPCGTAIGEDVFTAYKKAHDSDPVSIFGGIVAINREVDGKIAEELNKIFLEIVIAPSYSEEALGILKNKKNLRVIKCEVPCPQDKLEYIKVDGGILVQETNTKMIEEMKVVTEKQPSEREKQDMILGMKVVKHVKSNAIVVVKDGIAKGIGTGQTNRIWATIHALEHAKGEGESLEGAVLASDAFFPFRDCVDEAAKYGIKAIVQPGGSMRDQESVDACDEHGISMVFTGIRHFKH